MTSVTKSPSNISLGLLKNADDGVWSNDNKSCKYEEGSSIPGRANKQTSKVSLCDIEPRDLRIGCHSFKSQRLLCNGWHNPLAPSTCMKSSARWKAIFNIAKLIFFGVSILVYACWDCLVMISTHWEGGVFCLSNSFRVYNLTTQWRCIEAQWNRKFKACNILLGNCSSDFVAH